MEDTNPIVSISWSSFFHFGSNGWDGPWSICCDQRMIFYLGLAVADQWRISYFVMIFGMDGFNYGDFYKPPIVFTIKNNNIVPFLTFIRNNLH